MCPDNCGSEDDFDWQESKDRLDRFYKAGVHIEDIEYLAQLWGITWTEPTKRGTTN